MHLQRHVATGLALAGLSLLAAGAAQAQTTLNFDTGQNGVATFTGEKVNVAYPTSGVTFSSNALIATGSNDPAGVPSPPRFAATSDFVGTITALFDGTVSSVSAANVSYSSFRLSAFDAAGNLLGSSSVSNTLPDGAIASLSFANIKSVRFNVTAAEGQYGFDNFTFKPNSTTVPEPSPLAGIGLGVLGVGGLLLRARRRTAPAC